MHEILISFWGVQVTGWKIVGYIGRTAILWKMVCSTVGISESTQTRGATGYSG